MGNWPNGSAMSLVDSSIGAGCVANHGLRVGLVANHGSRAKRVSFGGWAMASRAKRVSLVAAPWPPAPKALVAWHGRGERDPQPRRTLNVEVTQQKESAGLDG